MSKGNEMDIRQNRDVDRWQQIVIMRNDGLSYNKIGLRLGISGERVRQILTSRVEKQPETSRTTYPLTTRGLAHLLNISPNTVRRWTNDGTIKAFYINSRGDRRFREEDIASFLAEQSEKRERIGKGVSYTTSYQNA